MPRGRGTFGLFLGVSVSAVDFESPIRLTSSLNLELCCSFHLVLAGIARQVDVASLAYL